MTWTMKLTRSDRPMVAEYLCPVHGRFELTVDRDANGDPPDEATCPALGLAHPLYQPRPEDSARDFREAERRGEWKWPPTRMGPSRRQRAAWRGSRRR